MDTKTTYPILDLDPKIARAIISEAAASGWVDGNMPENDEELIDLASSYVADCIDWVEKENPSNRHVDAIINLSKVSPPVISESADNTNDMETPPGEIDSEELDWENAEVYEPSQSYGAVAAGPLKPGDLVKVHPQIDIEYAEPDPSVGIPFGFYGDLPLPTAIPETQVNMPVDITELGDKAVRRLYSTFNSYLGRARWMLAGANSNLANASHLMEDTYRRKYKFYSRELVQQGERATKDLVDNFTRDDDEYKEWEEKVLKHEQDVIHWRALVEIYSKNVEVLSREWTMRTEEYERSK